VLADEMRVAGTLRGQAVVGTATTNSGLESFLAARGLVLLRADVGDRHVAALMRSAGANLGGETSGHILLPDRAPSGDGTRCAIVLLTAIFGRGERMSEALSRVPRFPVATRKVRSAGKPPLASLSGLTLAQVAIGAEIAGSGRVLVRWSGTEPLLRIQVEAEDARIAERAADRLAAAATADLAGTPPEAR
jgi:phosphoglucosamine mutase